MNDLHNNIFAEIISKGTDEDFVPSAPSEPTKSAPGSKERMEVLRKRLEAGQELSHPEDSTSFEDSEVGVMPVQNQRRERVVSGLESVSYSAIHWGRLPIFGK